MVSFSKSSQEGSSRNAVEEPTGRDDMSSQEGSSRNAVEEPTGRGDIQKCPEQSSLRDEKFIQQISQKELSREMLEKSSGRVKTNHRDSLTGNLSMRGLFTVRLKPSVFRARSSVWIILAMFAVAHAAKRAIRKEVEIFQKGIIAPRVGPDNFRDLAAPAIAFEGDWECYSQKGTGFKRPTSKASFTVGDMGLLEVSFTLLGTVVTPLRTLFKNVQGTSVMFFEQTRGFYWIVVPFCDAKRANAHTLAWYSTLSNESFYYTKVLDGNAEEFVPKQRNDPAKRMSSCKDLQPVVSDDGATDSGGEDNGPPSTQSDESDAGKQVEPTQWFCHCPGDWVISPVNASAIRHKKYGPRKAQLMMFQHTSGSKHANVDPDAYIGTLRQGTENCKVCTGNGIVCDDMPKPECQWISGRKTRRSIQDYKIEIQTRV